ncbi:DJ-1/PfpI family protein [Heyndrickxia vini]|uniref:DJ-1/PfpI family protein n=1 Tax=Heyndrickxia vini TaxID=1476025 RepID=A0ABX7E2G2_9BACI|nr:DJ-1/PfpI family protein [Heyndrickxia vini]QQZ09908.1 DJ-1/PfpI family protein [Heyndrickxia vini]
MKNILFLAYPQYADFEIAHTLFFLKKVGKANVTTVTIDGKPVESIAGLLTMPQRGLSEVNVGEYDLVLISGGDGVHTIINESVLHTFLQSAYSKEIPIAAICASATLLGKSGLLKGKRFTCNPNTYEVFKDVFQGANYTGENIEVETNLITAKGTAFPEFNVAVGDLLNIWKDSTQENWALQFCRGNI